MLPLLLLILPFGSALAASVSTNSTKRGLAAIAKDSDTDTKTLFSTNSTKLLTWYYNYAPDPTTSSSSTSDILIPSALSFAPMLWGTDAASNFVSTVLSQKTAPTHVLGFNEPDQDSSVGGSNISPSIAADTWKSSIEPLSSHNILLGAPAVSGSPNGIAWLESFMSACDGCTIDFIPLHWYGNFQGLADHLGQFRSKFPNMTLWVTELGWPNQGVEDTMNFFNESLEYLDRLDYIERYAWFGGFRDSDSNVGPNGAMLDDDGTINELGALYLGGGEGSKAADVSLGIKGIEAGGSLLYVMVAVGFLWAVWIQ